MTDEVEKKPEPEMLGTVVEAAVVEAVVDTDKRPQALKDKLVERSKVIRDRFGAHLSALDQPTTVAEIAKVIDANRVTVAKYITQSMAEGNPYNIGIKKVGMYEIVWKKAKKEEPKQ